jgi:hypothetical protein
MKTETKTALRDCLRNWIGDTTTTIAEIVLDDYQAIIWVTKTDGEQVNNLPEYGVYRAFMIRGRFRDEAVVSGDATSCTADEAFETLGRVIH